MAAVTTHDILACCFGLLSLMLFYNVSDTRMLACFIITEIRGVKTSERCVLYGTGVDSWTLRGEERCIQGFGG